MNVLDEILSTQQLILKKLDDLEKSRTAAPTKILLSEFCKAQGISRPTAHAWAEKGMIRLEKIGSRNFVIADSVTVVKKYQRKPMED